MISMKEDFLTVEEVAEKLRVSEETVKRLLRSNQMAGYKISGVWRIDQQDFLAYLAKQKNIQK